MFRVILNGPIPKTVKRGSFDECLDYVLNSSAKQSLTLVQG